MSLTSNFIKNDKWELNVRGGMKNNRTTSFYLIELCKLQ